MSRLEFEKVVDQLVQKNPCEPSKSNLLLQIKKCQ